LEHVGLHTAVTEVEQVAPLTAARHARQLHTTFEVEVAEVILAVPVDEHTDTAVHVEGLDAAVPK
jgi:hypothetical protein